MCANTPKKPVPNSEEIIAMELNKRISDNLKSLLTYQNIPYTKVISFLKQKDTYSITASYFNKLLNYPDKHKIPLIFVLQCADFFNVSLDDLFSEKFDPETALAKRSNIEPNGLLNISKIIEEYEQTEGTNSVPENTEQIKRGSHDSLESSTFITNPNNILFSSILQTYHCYFYPTVSRENSSINSILHGTLRFEKNGDKCNATLIIETIKKNKYNKPVTKIYNGYAVISTGVNNLYCILNNDIEYCFIIFRHFHLSHVYQDCHMAEVLSTSSAKKDRYPTALRMFLSKQKIEPEHMKFIAPHLWLNYSRITITEHGLITLKNESKSYAQIVDKLLQKSSNNMYYFKEKDAMSIASDYLTKDEALKFITDLRANSYAFHYAKVGDTVNESVRDLLKSLGYYQE